MSLFFIADNKVLDDVRLSSNDVRVYYKLVSYMNRHTGSCYPRHATISKAIGLSRSTIYRCTLHLAKLGYVKITRKSSTNEYHLPKQVILENTRKKQIVDNYVSNKSNYVSSLTDINKTIYKPLRNNNYRYNYNRAFSNRGVAKQSIEYEGETYIECGKEGHYIEYRNKKGNLIRKHTFKKDEPIKKFSAILEVAC